MPYLNMGEFYSEFGDYDVTITLPENYLVSATGELLTKSELERIKERHSYTKKYLDTTKLKNLMPSYEPVPLSQGLKETIDWYRNNKEEADSRN